MDRLEQYAYENKIPIMQKEGILFLQEYIKKNNIKSILEIGTAIGYSAIKMAMVDKNIKVITIEKDYQRYKEAITNIKEFNLDKNIKVILNDALQVEIIDKFDLIFIDGAKASYIKYFEKFKNNLNDKGTIITDNLNFHGLTEKNIIIKNKNLKALIRKINNYKDFLKNNNEFETKFINIGDGLAISTKNKK